MHMLRNIMYMSYLHNANVFVKGLVIYLLGMVVCFLGYSCNLARMAYWALRVVINMLNFVGVEMFPRVFVFHVLCAAITVMLALYHMFLLHWTSSTTPGSNNGEGKRSMFYFIFVKDLFLVWLLDVCMVVFP